MTKRIFAQLSGTHTPLLHELSPNIHNQVSLYTQSLLKKHFGKRQEFLHCQNQMEDSLADAGTGAKASCESFPAWGDARWHTRPCQGLYKEYRAASLLIQLRNFDISMRDQTQPSSIQ